MTIEVLHDTSEGETITQGPRLHDIHVLYN